MKPRSWHQKPGIIKVKKQDTDREEHLQQVMEKFNKRGQFWFEGASRGSVANMQKDLR